MPDQHDLPEEALGLAEQSISRLLERGFELYDQTGVRLRFSPGSVLSSTAARASLQAAAPAIRAAAVEEERERMDPAIEALRSIVRGMDGPDSMKPKVPWPARAAYRIAKDALAALDQEDSP